MKKFTFLLLLALVFGIAKSTVVYFTPNTSTFDWQISYLYLDVNNDGFNDFIMTAQASTGLNESWFKIKSLTAGSKILTDGTGKANGLNDSVVISAQVPSNLWADSAWIYRSVSGPFPYPINTHSNLAFKFMNGNNTHFGYISGYASWDSQGPGFYSYNLHRIGYESDPNGPIKAASVTSIVGTPEPKIPQFTVAQGGNGGFHITFDRNVEGDFQILDVQGKILATYTVHGQSLDVIPSDLSRGIYLLQFTSTRIAQPLRITKKVVM